MLQEDGVQMPQNSVVQGGEQMMKRVISEESHNFEEIVVDVIAVHDGFELVHAPVYGCFPDKL